MSIEIDLNRITRRDFRQFTDSMKDAEGLEQDKLTGEMIEKVVTKWPFDKEITADNYLDLPLGDSQIVDRALTNAFSELGEKK